MSDRLGRIWLPMAPLLPFKPMPIAWGNRAGESYGGIKGFGSERLARAWHRAESSGRISVGTADDICVHMLRMHPAEVFGELWWTA